MKTTQIRDNVWQLTRLSFVNCYLVRDDEGLILIDTGIPGSANSVLQAAETIGLPITRMTLTHAHGDHAGSLDEISQRLPDVEVALTGRTGQFLQGELSLRADEPQAKLRGSFFNRTTPAARTLAAGDKLGSLRIVASPGHTPDHIAFLDERDGTLIAGDAFQTLGGIAVSGMMRWLFPLPAMATWHLPTALASAKELRQLEPAALAVGHGPALVAPLAQMDQAIQAAEARVNG
jgi:glyoxylase-like metal-dependent hydrolase (beta-lactamase superfamily II)